MSVLNDKKVAFIVCVNDADVFAECQYYLDKLSLPEGFGKDVIAVWDAPSMAAGYNAGMNDSDAKYKVYIHQDVMIVNRDFVAEICKVFESDPGIGILGCIGATKLGKEAMAVTAWDTGKIMHNLIPLFLEFEEVDAAGSYTQVMALDGLLLATQYDIPWREDIMDGWDFYDISQCMEFARAGYKAVVPRQQKAWCYHDNSSSKMLKYNHYRRRFVEEYAQEGPFEMPPEWEGRLEYEQQKQRSMQVIGQLIESGDHRQLHGIFKDPANREYIHLKEYEVIADIDYLEQQAGTGKRLWMPGMGEAEVQKRVRLLKYWMKRIDHQVADTAEIMDAVMLEYSIYAVIEIFIHYVAYKEYAYHTIIQYFGQKGMEEEAAILNLAMQKI